MFQFPTDQIPEQEYIYSTIFALSNRLQLLGDRRKEELTTKQCYVLACIALFEDYTLNLKDVAQMAGTSSQNVKKIMAILEKKGYGIFARDENDGRNLRVALTPRGKEYYRKRSEEEVAYIGRFFEGIEENELSGLYCGLRKMMENTFEK